jgi:drug/metabolite transporter (DMT)-like permease
MDVSSTIANFRGEIAALTAAFLWAASSTIYAILGNKIPALLLNLIKGLIALFFLILTLLITQENIIELNLLTIFLLAISGVIGIGIGDTAYFHALNHLGARKTLLIETLAPPLTAILALICLGEILIYTSYFGIMITIIGVAWVISEKTAEVINNRQKTRQGLKWALLGVVCQASGAVISRYAFSLTDISPLWSTLFRLVGGTIIILFLLVKQPINQLQILKSIGSLKLYFIITITAFISTFLGIWLQQTSFKFAPVGIAQTLLATSPLFVIPLASFLGEKVTFRSIFGVLIALLGISLLFI